ncbi:putative esterase YcpF (UPF0227 family) [Oceanisphaera litoralis]|uniref:YqiA/YcfP family alpha/beta fold hydrolase n=1 Tax=Oceanisphaera litoralis TaxID=225144 RepID=UPI001959D223|nr:YqiA/YcfP family alpha/beta fold hydrolase [Oceanisphaera litoralis]MBM7457242.1 putative esterase YcpF (UPF0227 family) [Oceanisphaera litoralis]
MILFFHGLDSDNETTKFTAISHSNKFCKRVDYRRQSHEDISRFYDGLITQYKPALLVGHSLGGYWALMKSDQHSLPCVLVNPQFYPSFRSDYSDLDPANCDPAIPRFVYLEMGDEVLDIERIYHALKGRVSRLEAVLGGHHRVANLDRMDELVTLALADIVGR